MGITSIFVSQWKVTDGLYRIPLLDWGCGGAVPGNSLHVSPYPKPTQVDW